MLSSWLGFSQVSSTFDFTSDMQGWTSTSFTHTTTSPCDVGSVRANLYTWNDNLTFTSPALGVSNGNPITMDFDTKAINWSGGAAAPANAFNMDVQWSTSPSGPWNTISTISNTTSSATCTTNSVTFTPTGGVFYIRFLAMIQGNNDIYVYIDNVSFSQDPSDCDPPTDLSVTLMSFTSADFSWQQNGNTITDYDYEIRTSGAPGSGPTGLVDSGSSTGTSVSSTVLTPATDYIFYVRKNCTGGTPSAWNAASFYTEYCTPSVTYTYDYISSFSTTNALQNVSYTASSNPGNGYSNQSSQIIEQAQGLSFNFSTTYVGGSNGVNIWIDFNNNLIFEPSENVFSYQNSGVTTTGEITIPLSVPVGQYRMRVRAQWGNLPPPCGEVFYGTTLDYTLSVLPAPSCLPPVLPAVADVTKNSAFMSWTSDGEDFDLEILPAGQTPTGTPTDPMVSNNFTKTGLTPNTSYDYYVRQNCGTSTSFWVGPVNFTTMCEYPDLLDVDVAPLCGYGTVEMTASSTTGIIQWFESPTGVPLATGNTFTTPFIEENTTFYLRTGSINPNTNIQVGEGTTITTDIGNPYYYSYSGYKYQYTFTAQELIAAGLSAGPINSVAFDVVTGSTVARNNFRVYIGNTTQSTATTTHVPVSDLTLVYSNAAQTVTPGINTYNFTTPFVWDGVSNILVQTVFSNGGSYNYSDSGSVRTHTAPATRTSYFYSDSASVDQFVNNTTTISGMYSSTSSTRPNIIFNGVGLCSSPYIPVEAIVTEAPALELSATSLDVCQGNYSEPLTIVTGAEDYDTFEWLPSTNVSGDALSGWIFNPQTDMTYTLIASQSTGSCAKTLKVKINVASLGYEILDENYFTCSGDPLELTIIEDMEDISSFPTLTLAAFGFNDPANLGVTLSGTGTSLAVESDDFTEGASSLHWTYSNNALAYLEFDGTYDASSGLGLMVEFDHIAILESNSWDWGHVQYSLDGGSTWVNFQTTEYLGNGIGMTAGTTGLKFSRTTYSQWVSINAPADNLWRKETLFLSNENLDLSNVKIRFSLRSDSSGIYDGWYIDNVKIKKVSLAEILWSPATYLYLDQELTQPYNGESVGTVYFSHTEPGNYTFFANISSEDINCETTISTEVIIPELVFPGLTNEYYCDVVDVNDLEFDAQNGVQYYWYNSIFSQTPIDSIPFSGTYYVQVVAGECSGTRQAVPITIVGDVNVTATANQTYCEGATVANLMATPSSNLATVNWYDSETATEPLTADTPLVSGVTYYVNQVLHGCESEKLSVNVSLDPIPDPIDSTEITICANTLLSDVDIDGESNLHWYTSMSSSTPMTGQIILTPGTYYVAKYQGVCDSERVVVTVNVVENLATPQVNVIDICGSGTVGDLDAYVTGTNTLAQLRWFSSATSTTPLTPDQVLSTGTYYVEQYITGCTSNRKAVSVRVTSKVAPIINAQQVCQGTTLAEVEIPAVSGVTYNWYSSPSSTTVLPATTVLTSGNYYVRRVQYGCESDFTIVPVTVLPIPASPTGESVQVLPFESVVSDIAMDQNNIVWYITYEDAINNINPLDPNMPLLDGQVYYGVLFNANGCGSLPTAVTVQLFLGINDLDIASLNIYPNPTSDYLNVSYKESMDRIEVYSILGQKVIETKVNHTETSIDLSHLAAGTYMIKVIVGANSQLVKVIKK